MKKYVLIAGVNGVGKTTLFSLIHSLSEIEKINLDETVRELGDWKDSKAVLQAGKIVVGKIASFFMNEISFSQETTLCGRSIMKNVAKAKALGYYIEMHYIGVDNPEIAKERVHNRVKQGGHGMPDADIERRYKESFQNLKKIIPLCDSVVFYDNSREFRRFAINIQGTYIKLSDQIPKWYEKIGDTN